jgi:hypothetical protein
MLELEGDRADLQPNAIAGGGHEASGGELAPPAEKRSRGT